MGLDITAYAKLAAAPDAKVDEDGYPEDYDTHVKIDREMIEFIEKQWPGRTAGLTPGIFIFGEEHDFCAGSYSGYNHWRDWLAKVVDWDDADACWRSGKTEGPFIELINFPDNEGYIGPMVAAKLAKDFADNEARAAERADGDAYLMQKYRDWKRAFELAADAGAVRFH